MTLCNTPVTLTVATQSKVDWVVCVMCGVRKIQDSAGRSEVLNMEG